MLFDAYHEDVSVILSKLIYFCRFNNVSPSIPITDITTASDVESLRLMTTLQLDRQKSVGTMNDLIYTILVITQQSSDSNLCFYKFDDKTVLLSCEAYFIVTETDR